MAIGVVGAQFLSHLSKKTFAYRVEIMYTITGIAILKGATAIQEVVHDYSC